MGDISIDVSRVAEAVSRLWMKENPNKALRALLTDEEGLPRVGVVRRHDPVTFKVTYTIPGDWLETEDET